MSGRCFVRVAVVGVGRSAIYGGGSCQMSVRHRWAGRGECEEGRDGVGVVGFRGEVVGVGRWMRSGAQQQKMLEGMC